MTSITLNDGNKIPAVGFGVFLIPADGPTYDAVLTALKAGYRHIDTAAAYFNEADVGRAVRDSGVPREEIFITSKLWLQDYGYEAAKKGLETSLEKLGMDRYVEDFIKNAPNIELEREQLTCRDRAAYAKEQLLSTIRKVTPYILIGVAIGAVIHNMIPQTWVETVLGSRNPVAVILATLVGIPMYADIFGTIPVAESLLFKGASLGTILSFMMAVTTLSLPSLIMLKKAVKPRLLAAFIGICTAGIILVGYFFNFFQYFFVI